MSRIILIQSFIQAVGRPLVMGIHAVGKMKWVNIIAGGCLLLIMPLSYVCLKIGVSLYLVLIIIVLPWFSEALIDAIFLSRYAKFNIKSFYIRAYGSVFLITLAAFVVPMLLYYCMSPGLKRFLIVLGCSILWSGILIYKFGISCTVRNTINTKLRKWWK